MTEIPEHLLKRSKSAKQGKSGDDAGEPSTEASTTAVTPTAGAAAPAGQPPALVKAAASIGPDRAPAPAKPEPTYITAAKTRKKMPIWAMGMVFALPIWAWIYAGTMQQQEVEDVLFVESAELYTGAGGCAGCHGAGGGGGMGYAFTDGELIATFPEPIDTMVHIARGSGAINGEQYGDPDRSGGARVAGQRGNMPAYEGSLSVEQLEAIVFHERIALAGEALDSPEYIEWEIELREKLETGESNPIDLELLLSCANPEYTPGATGAPEDPEECPGPPSAGGEEAAMGG